MSGRLSGAVAVERLELDGIAATLAGQPELFVAVPLLQDAPLFAAAKRGRFTGQNLLRDEQRCLVIASLVLAGVSDRQIAETVGCARESIPMVVRELELRGAIRPLKERVEARIGRVGEAVLQRLQTLMDRANAEHGGLTDRETQEVRAESVLAGICADKMGISGAPQVHLHAHEHRVQPVGDEALRRYRELLRGAPEDESAGDALDVNELRRVDTVTDTGEAGDLGVVGLAAVAGTAGGGAGGPTGGGGAFGADPR